jgi:hypothetical protein
LKTTRIITIMALLLAFQMTGTPQDLGNSTSVNPAANISLANATLANASPAKASTIPLQLEGIWSFNLVGRGPVTAVLHQRGEVITGSAKSDGVQPWNAVLQGALSADQMVLNLISLGNNSLITLQLEGNARNETIQGSYIRVDDQGGFEDGLFTGKKIDADLSIYAPATILTAGTVGRNASAPEEAEATAKPATALPDTTTKPVALGNPKYRDVHSLAGTVPESLGVGFVGDGTAGAGAMGLG